MIAKNSGLMVVFAQQVVDFNRAFHWFCLVVRLAQRHPFACVRNSAIFLTPH